MNPEDALLLVALGATASAWVLAVFRLRSPRIRLSLRVPRYLLTTVVSLSLATLLMIGYFLFVRLDIEYVHSYTSQGTPWYYRVAGLWAGQKGTLLIWATASAAVMMINDRVWRRRIQQGLVPDSDSLRVVLAWVLVVGLGVLMAFEALLLVGGTFDRTDPYLLRIRDQGTPLQPVLRTPFMIIHPPLQFIGYAFATLLFATGITAILTRRREWADVALPWARWAFLVATVGLGLGGLWAYYVLNFGGYWAWDPVETANLLAWFPLLLLLHGTIYYRKRGMFSAAAPIYAVLSLLAVLFSTIATRSGLWISVHAFTDPTKNFASDPLLRMLNILDTSAILQWLCAMFLSALFVTLVAFLHRLQVDHRVQHGQDRRWVRGIMMGSSWLLVAASLLAFMDASFVLSAVFELADLVGFGNAPVGLGLLVALIGLLYASPGLVGPEEAPEGSREPWLDSVSTPRMTFLGMVFISLGFLVTFLLLMMSVNGYHRSVYDTRAPIVALPVLLVMGIAFAHPTLGRKPALVWASAAAGAGIAGAVLVPGYWQVALVLPGLLWALLASGIKLYKVSDLGKAGDARLRVAGLLLLVGGVAVMSYWSNPPTRIALGFGQWEPSAWWAPLGFLAGLGAALSSVGVLRQKTVRAHRVGALLCIVGFGFGFGVLAGILAFALGESRRGRFPDVGNPLPVRACAAGLKRELRKSGVYLMHVGIVLGLLGFTLSTYLQQPETELEIGPGSPASAHGYEFRLVGSSAGPPDASQDGILSEVRAHVEVRRGGEVLNVARLTMWLELERHYAERVSIQRYALEDVYLRPVEFVTPERTFLAHEDNVALYSGEVSQVTFTVRTLPGMHLLWAGLWIVTGGMLVSLWAGGARFEASKPSAGGRPAAA